MKGREFGESVFAPIIGVSTTRAELGYGTFITIHWGKNVVEEMTTKRGIRTFVFGEWHLWVYMCVWRIERNHRPIIAAGDQKDLIRSRLRILENKKLQRVTIINDAFDAELEFEESCRLLLFSFLVDDCEQWLLYTPGKKVFVAGPGKEWSYENSSE